MMTSFLINSHQRHQAFLSSPPPTHPDDNQVAWGEVMAYLSTITIPILILFLALQRAFVESITSSSGIKG